MRLQESNRKSNRLFLVAAALLLLPALMLAFLHHHNDSDTHDCIVCHFIKQVVYAFALVIVFIAVLLAQKFFIQPLKKLTSQFLASNLQNRAPPFLASIS